MKASTASIILAFCTALAVQAAPMPQGNFELSSRAASVDLSEFPRIED